MKCTWEVGSKPHTHIPKVCGRDAVVIFQGPRKHQYAALCEEHKTFGYKLDSELRSWKEFTPDDFKVYQVMSE